jgi:hypothetical protein
VLTCAESNKPMIHSLQKPVETWFVTLYKPGTKKASLISHLWAFDKTKFVKKIDKKVRIFIIMTKEKVMLCLI